ncbi:hypothetical protein [Umezawaea sp.]|uniref:hypothetical protein n=1 Tax=Umezawaea sp. TaxID=1955258 RepID=UPI002ED08EDE
MDLDDELRRLFQDQRLEIPVKPGADHAVVTGARRVRRRRVALASAGSAFAVAALVAGGIALAGLGGPASMPPAGPPTSEVTKTVTVEQPPSSGSVGFGVLKLGMAEADAVATGFITRTGDDSLGCHQYSSQGHPDMVGAVVVSPSAGVVRITIPSTAKTSMGIGVGSTVAEVKARYPSATAVLAGFVVHTGGALAWNYVFHVQGTGGSFQDADRVTMIRMQLDTAECFLEN